MLTSSAQLRTFIDSLKVLIRNGDPNALMLAKRDIDDLLKGEYGDVEGKKAVLNALQQGVDTIKRELSGNPASLNFADTVSDYIARIFHEFQPEG